MPRGPKISEAVEALIFEETRDNINKPRELLALDIQEKIERYRYPVPSEETIIKRISKYRNRPDPMNEPWTIADNTFKEGENEYKLNPDSITFLTQMWRYSIFLGEPISKRQIKWLSILFPSHKKRDDDSTALYWFYSKRLSIEDEMSKATNIPMRLNFLTAKLYMNNWEILHMLGSRVLDPEISHYIQSSTPPMSENGNIIEELLYAIPINLWKRPKDNEEGVHNLKLYNLFTSLPSANEFFPDYSLKLIYLKHLANMSKGKYWTNFDPDKLVELVLQLRDWVILWNDNLTKEETEDLFVNIDESKKLPESAFPIELYKMAGFDMGEI